MNEAELEREFEHWWRMTGERSEALQSVPSLMKAMKIVAFEAYQSGYEVEGNAWEGALEEAKDELQEAQADLKEAKKEIEELKKEHAQVKKTFEICSREEMDQREEVKRLRESLRVAQVDRETLNGQLRRLKELVRMHRKENWGVGGLVDDPDAIGEVHDRSDRMLYEGILGGE